MMSTMAVRSIYMATMMAGMLFAVNVVAAVAVNYDHASNDEPNHHQHHHRRVYANHLTYTKGLFRSASKSNDNTKTNNDLDVDEKEWYDRLFFRPTSTNNNENQKKSISNKNNNTNITTIMTHRHRRRLARAMSSSSSSSSSMSSSTDSLTTDGIHARRFLDECASGDETTFYYFNFVDGTLVTGSTSDESVVVKVSSKPVVMDVTCDGSNTYDALTTSLASYELVKCLGGNIYQACDSTEIDFMSSTSDVVEASSGSSVLITKGGKKASEKKGDEKEKEKKSKGDDDGDMSMSYSYMYDTMTDVDEPALEWIVVKGAGKKAKGNKGDKKSKKKGGDMDSMSMSMSMSMSYNVDSTSSQTYFYTKDGQEFSPEEILAMLPADSVLHALVEERIVAEELSSITSQLRTSSLEGEAEAVVPVTASASTGTVAMAATAAGLIALTAALVLLAKKMIAKSGDAASIGADADGTFDAAADAISDEYDVVDLQ